MLEFTKLMQCCCIKGTIKENVVVGPSAIGFISFGSTKQVGIAIREDANYIQQVRLGKGDPYIRTFA